MNSDLQSLHPYPFQKLAALFADVTPPSRAKIALSIGEPKHPTPHFIEEAVMSHMNGLANYPITKGRLELREAISTWLTRRFQLPEHALDAEKHVLPVNGTREALFAFAQAVVNRADKPIVISPNPFYQIYEGAALLAGAEPYYLDATEESDFLPDYTQVPEHIWQRTQLVYLCTPSNPTGAVMNQDALQDLINKAEQYDFVIASDECYSEIYFDEAKPPVGLLQAAAAMGNSDFKRCVVFHSLSKRSNAPGLRSGFVAGDAKILQTFLQYRTYHGCAMSLPFQAASITAWSDEAHVVKNRAEYREKFQQVQTILSPVLDVRIPEGAFYLWQKLPIDDREFAKRLYAKEHIVVLPGHYLSRESERGNPGQHYVRMALVASLEECVDAAERIKHLVITL